MKLPGINGKYLVFLALSLLSFSTTFAQTDGLSGLVGSLLANAGPILSELGDAINEFPIETVDNSSRIQNRYILKLKNDVPDEWIQKVDDVLNLVNASITRHYGSFMKGCSLEFPGELPLDILRRIPWIEYIEEDQSMVSYQIQQTDEFTWGLDRIDQTSSELNGEYIFDGTGKGVNVYILDSGIDVSHSEFGGRAETIFSTQGVGRDCSGHGTHVGGIIGGTNAGVAKEVNLRAVQVIGCSDTTNTDLISALDFVIQNHQKPAIINMSLGPRLDASGNYPRSRTLDRAIEKAVEAGISVFVAAGNDGRNGCAGSPAGSPGVFTIGAINQRSVPSSFSNFGECLLMFAPGTEIASAAPGGGFTLKSGTSQAAPFAAGVAALFLERNPEASPAQVGDALSSAAVDVSGNIVLQSTSKPDPTSVAARSQFVSLDPNAIRNSIRNAGFFGLSTDKILLYSGIILGSVLLIGIVFAVYRRRKRSRRIAKEVSENAFFNANRQTFSVERQKRPRDSSPVLPLAYAAPAAAANKDNRRMKSVYGIQRAQGYPEGSFYPGSVRYDETRTHSMYAQPPRTNMYAAYQPEAQETFYSPRNQRMYR